MFHIAEPRARVTGTEKLMYYRNYGQCAAGTERTAVFRQDEKIKPERPSKTLHMSIPRLPQTVLAG